MARQQRDNLRELILDAAQKRMWLFGIKKTTIEEIAADLGIGKGTIYLYFESKEQIAFALIVGFKECVYCEQSAIAADANIELIERFKRVLRYPVTFAHTKCKESPLGYGTIGEIHNVFRQDLLDRLRTMVDKEIALIASLIEEGNRAGIFHVVDSVQQARTVKLATAGLFPGHSLLIDDNMIENDLESLIEMAIRSFK
jgi:AcrR family transcriptional regulator